MNKSKISIVVPVFNELRNIERLILRITESMEESGSPYEIIFIDDNSTDGTYEYLHRYSRSKTIKFYQKKGKKGKAYSLIEGFRYVTGDVIVMIDGDLQYPPEAILPMVRELENSDVVVSDRKNYKSSKLRRFLSKSFKLFSGKFLFGLSADVQSGLKVFKKEVWSTVAFMPKSQWTFDLEFLHKAQEAGYKLVNHPITFYKREGGYSKINLISTVAEIGFSTLVLKLKKIHPQTIMPEKNMIGAGIGYKKKKYITHTTLPHHLSALSTTTFKQKLFFVLLTFVAVYGLFLNTYLSFVIIIGFLSLIYFFDSLFNLYIILKSINSPVEINVDLDDVLKLDNKKLPVYTILCPLYKESHIIPQFLEAISKIDWPKDKLDVILLLEEDDPEAKAVAAKKFPEYVRAVIVPHSQPKTKPKACNYGLSLARGEYLVIYDAEDIPDPLQLKKAYIAFRNTSDKIVCLQAKLNYYNPHQNLLTRFFTAEYSLWFDITLTGLQSLNTSLPLGGTSNHFKTKILLQLEGWDPFNVTEDADLGVRLFYRGYKTAVIDSTTYEEANSSFRNWIRQRSRWIKGYMQTYLVHMRNTYKFARKSGHHAAIFHFILGGKIAFILINPILWITTISYFAFYDYVGAPIESLYSPLVFYMAVFSLVFGNFLFLFYYMIGSYKRGHFSIIKYTFLIPFYWVMMSAAGIVAFYQLIFKPHYWEKTIHGLHLNKANKNSSANKKSEKENFSKYALSNVYDLFGLFSTEDYQNKSKPTRNRILVFNWRDIKHVYAGGAEAYVHEIAKRLVEDGNQVTVFCGNDGKNPRHEVIDGVNIIRIGGTYTVYIWAVLYYFLKLRKNFDIIIDSENGIPFFSPIFSRVPVILLIHHIHQDVFRKHLIFPLSILGRVLEAYLMPLVYRKNTVITVSDSSKNEIKKLSLGFGGGIHVVSPGIEQRDFRRTSKAKYPLITYLGRLKPYKNIDIAITAFANILKKYPHAYMFIVGEGESLVHLQRLTKKLDIDLNVFFLGKVGHDEKIKILGQSWAVLQPSMIEGFGLTVIEANACGTPVIASNVLGLKDSIVNNSTGLLVDSKDIDGFTNAIEKIITNDSFRNALSERAHDWSRNFNWDKSTQSLVSVIESKLIKNEYILNIKNAFAGR